MNKQKLTVWFHEATYKPAHIGWYNRREVIPNWPWELTIHRDYWDGVKWASWLNFIHPSEFQGLQNETL